MPVPALSPCRPHAVVVPWPGQGHINPLMHFSKKLASQGFTITFVNTQYAHLRILQSSQHSQLLLDEEDAALDIRFVALPDGLPDDHSDVPVVRKAIAITQMYAAFEDLIDRLVHEGRPPVTCIISDIFVLPTQDVANKYGLPRVAFWTQSAASYAAHLLVAKGYRPPLDRPKNEKVITWVPGAPPLRLQDMPNYLQTYDTSDFMFNFVTEPFLRLDEATWVVVNTFDELERPAVDALLNQHQQDISTIGPLLPTDYFNGSLKAKMSTYSLWREDHDCLKWLDALAPSSVLYVSFGSTTVLSSEEIQQFALGLEASGLPLLWVLRPGLLVGGHSAILPEGFQDRTKDRVLLITWAPQLHVLSHPSVGGFLTHAGWNSTLEGMVQGLPMLGFPYFGDQMLDCRCMADQWKNGLNFDVDENGMLTRFEVEKKVRALMEEKEIRQRAHHIKEAARRAVVEGGSSSNNLKALTNSIIETTLSNDSR